MHSVTSGTGCPDGLTLGWKSQPVLCVLMAFFFFLLFSLAGTLQSVQFAHTRSTFMWLSHLHICWVFFFPSVLIAALFAFVEGKWNLTEKPLPSRKTVQLEPISPLAFQSKWKEGGADNSL